tara:strand:+ start:205 stop:519 length:315 start_codon:yes stop_codon:yes gene_type:complete
LSIDEVEIFASVQLLQRIEWQQQNDRYDCRQELLSSAYSGNLAEITRSIAIDTNAQSGVFSQLFSLSRQKLQTFPQCGISQRIKKAALKIRTALELPDRDSNPN